MENLCKPETKLWDNIGLGGSQKCELVTADSNGWKYDAVDVAEFLRDEFPVGRMVDALHGDTWRRCKLVKQAGANRWEVSYNDPKTTFQTHMLRRPENEMETLLDTVGWGLREASVAAAFSM